MHRLRAAFTRPTQSITTDIDEAMNAPSTALAHRYPMHSAHTQSARQGVPMSIRARRLMRTHQWIGKRFHHKTPNQKIDWLLRAVDELREGDHPHLTQIIVNARRLSKKEALDFALEIAIESQRDRVQALCTRVLQEQEAEDRPFILFGAPFPRARVADWAREGIPDAAPAGRAEIQHFIDTRESDFDLNYLYTAPTYDPISVIPEMIATRWHSARSEYTPNTKESIQRHLGRRSASASAINGFEIAWGHTAPVNDKNRSVRDAVSLLYDYIDFVPGKYARRRLEASMETTFEEIYRDLLLATGMIDRLNCVPMPSDWRRAERLALALYEESIANDWVPAP